MEKYYVGSINIIHPIYQENFVKMLSTKVIKISSEINIYSSRGKLILEGSQGINYLTLPKLLYGYNFRQLDDNLLRAEYSGKTNKNIEKKHQNTLLSIIQQKIVGVTGGFFLLMDIMGVGYRVSLEDQTLILKLGYSHSIGVEVPKTIRCFSPKPTLLYLYSVDLHYLTQFGDMIRKLKQPNAYNGKGIRFQNQIIHLRQGKR